MKGIWTVRQEAKREFKKEEPTLALTWAQGRPLPAELYFVYFSARALEVLLAGSRLSL